MGEGEGSGSEGWKAGALSCRSTQDCRGSKSKMGKVQSGKEALMFPSRPAPLPAHF